MVGLKFGLFLLPFLDSKIAGNYKPELFLKICDSDEEARLSDSESISSYWLAVGGGFEKGIKEIILVAGLCL